MQTKTRLTKKRVKKPCTVAIDASPSVSLRNMDNLTDRKDGGTGEGGGLVMQERMTYSDAAKVSVNAKADTPDASNASNMDTPKINVKIGIVKPCTIAISLS